MPNIKRANTSGITKSGVAVSDVPDAPIIGSATGVGLSASITYTAAATGGTATTFTAISTPGALTGTGSSPITVSGLTDGTSYTFTVRASNSAGNSPLSSSSNSISAALPMAGGFDALGTVTLSETTSSVVFAGIPAGYKHLQIRALTITNSVSSGANMRFNDDAASNYKGHGLYGTGSGAAAVTVTSPIYAPNFNGGAATTAPGTAIIDISDYSSNTKYKTVRSVDGYDANGSGYIGISSGLWMSTEPISKITFTLTSYLAGCQFALYGVK